MKTLIHYTAGIVFSLCLMAALLITSVEAVVYWTPGYFEKEYAKYNVTEAVDMTMEAAFLLYTFGFFITVEISAP